MQLTLVLHRRQRELIGQLAREIGASAAAELQGVGTLQLKQQIEEMLQRGGPLLLVLDDIWSGFQLSQLLGSGCLPKGSQLLLTSRRSDVLTSYNPTPMKLLSDASALTLLAWHAYGQMSLPAHLEQVAVSALQRCGGLPLAIKVLGGALRRELSTTAAWTVNSPAHGRLRGLELAPCFHLVMLLYQVLKWSCCVGQSLSIHNQRSKWCRCGQQDNDRMAGDQLLGLAR